MLLAQKRRAQQHVAICLITFYNSTSFSQGLDSPTKSSSVPAPSPAPSSESSSASSALLAQPVVRRRQQQQKETTTLENNAAYRCSLINLEETRDDELDQILGELSVLESQFEDEIAGQSRSSTTSKSHCSASVVIMLVGN